MKFPVLTEDRRLVLLEPVTSKVSIVFDTDTFNEIDDQFAVVYAMLSPEQLDVQAIHAAPFHNARSNGPGDGMEKSYDEILHLMEKLDHKHDDNFVQRGSTQWLADSDTPVQSDAANQLVKLAMQRQPGDTPLYVVTTGACTNVASAILIEPAMIERIVVVWLGGNARHWPTAREFNLYQDIPAARVLFDSGVPVVLLPCQGVTSHLRTTVPEINLYVDGQGAVGNYLAQIFRDHHDDHFAWSKVLWDLAPVAWLVKNESIDTEIVSSPMINKDETWAFDESRHKIRSATFVHRDMIYRDLFEKLAR